MLSQDHLLNSGPSQIVARMLLVGIQEKSDTNNLTMDNSYISLNDDAIAACLDWIYTAGPDQTFTNLSLSVYTKFDLNNDFLHGDTSNITVHGGYDMCDEEGNTGLKTVQGHSKAHRPDKNQVGIGQIVNKDGIPLISQTLDGNKVDYEWNAEAIPLLRSVLSADILANVIYVADCKLVTMPIIHLLCKTKDDKGNAVIPVQFVSLVPNNLFNKIAEKLVAQAYLDNNWSKPVSLNANKLTQYRIQSYTRKLEGHELRFIVVESTSKQVEKAKKAFEKDVEIGVPGILFILFGPNYKGQLTIMVELGTINYRNAGFFNLPLKNSQDFLSTSEKRGLSLYMS